jgi:hypothetical protein
VIGEMDLERRNAWQRPGRRANLRREVGQCRQVVSERCGFLSKPVTGQLHAVTGISGESDDDTVDLLDLFGHRANDLLGRRARASPLQLRHLGGRRALLSCFYATSGLFGLGATAPWTPIAIRELTVTLGVSCRWRYPQVRPPRVRSGPSGWRAPSMRHATRRPTRGWTCRPTPASERRPNRPTTRGSQRCRTRRPMVVLVAVWVLTLGACSALPFPGKGNHDESPEPERTSTAYAKAQGPERRAAGTAGGRTPGPAARCAFSPPPHRPPSIRRASTSPTRRRS